MKNYPEQTDLSRLYFSLVAKRNGAEELICDNCMINESSVSVYFSVEVSNIYSMIRVFNSETPIYIEPGTIIFNQSESAVKEYCGFN